MALLFGYCRMVEIIAEFASRYLAEAAKHTQIKDFHSLPYLVDRFFFYNPDPKHIDVSGEAALSNDLEQLRRTQRIRRFPPGSGGFQGERALREERKPLFVPRDIRRILLSNEMVQVMGSKRGATYGNINARPRLSDEAIAFTIEKILYHNPGSHRWSDLCSPVITMIKQIHFQGIAIADKHPDMLFTPNIKTQSLDKILKDGLDMKFKVDVPNLDGGESLVTIGYSQWGNSVWDRKFRESDEQIDLWIDTNYSEDWFVKSTSNIQRLLKKNSQVIAGTGSNEVKRGFWMHADQVTKLSRKPNRDIVPTIITDHVGNLDEFIHVADTNDPREKHHLEQLKGDLNFLIDAIDRRLQNQN